MATAATAKGLNKSELKAKIAGDTGLSVKQVGSVLDSLATVAQDQLRKRTVQQFSLPGVVKLRVIRKPATKKRTGINPFTKLTQVFAAKPARNVVRARPLKAVKDAVSQ
jgi:nucleoid DNA-binding protein